MGVCMTTTISETFCLISVTNWASPGTTSCCRIMYVRSRKVEHVVRCGDHYVMRAMTDNALMTEDQLVDAHCPVTQLPPSSATGRPCQGKHGDLSSTVPVLLVAPLLQAPPPPPMN